MRDLLYIVVGLLIAIWVVVFLSLNASGPVHALLILAIIVILVRVFTKRKLIDR